MSMRLMCNTWRGTMPAISLNAAIMI